jgi:hypothetical protein
MVNILRGCKNDMCLFCKALRSCKARKLVENGDEVEAFWGGGGASKGSIVGGEKGGDGRGGAFASAYFHEGANEVAHHFIKEAVSFKS